MCFEGVPAHPYIFWGDRVTWKSPSRVRLESYYNTSGSFLCTAASTTPIRIVIREVRYIHELSLILEHSMPISSPTALGLTAAFCFFSFSPPDWAASSGDGGMQYHVLYFFCKRVVSLEKQRELLIQVLENAY